MSNTPPRVVYDCNVYLQAIMNPRGPAGSCARLAFEGKASLFISEGILTELRSLYERPTLVRLGATTERTETLIANLLKVATLIPVVPVVFTYERDPDDAHYVNVALAADARLIVSRDKDLLDLMGTNRAATDFQRRFPTLKISDPVSFLNQLDATSQG